MQPKRRTELSASCNFTIVPLNHAGTPNRLTHLKTLGSLDVSEIVRQASNVGSAMRAMSTTKSAILDDSCDAILVKIELEGVALGFNLLCGPHKLLHVRKEAEPCIQAHPNKPPQTPARAFVLSVRRIEGYLVGHLHCWHFPRPPTVPAEGAMLCNAPQCSQPFP